MGNAIKIKVNDIDNNFILRLKEDFKDKEILITKVESLTDLEDSIENIEDDKNLKTFSLTEFEKYSNELVRDKK